LEELERNVVVAELDALLIEPYAVDLHAGSEFCRGELGRIRDREGESGVLSYCGQTKWLRSGGDPPAGGRVQLHRARGVRASGRDLNRHRARGAGREKLHARREAKRDRRDADQSAPHRPVRGIRRRHRLAGNHEGLTADFKDVFERERGWVFRTADERRIVHTKQARRAFVAEPIRLAW
jgi:hypothetical protein